MIHERNALLDLLVEHSYDYQDQPVFRLSSGRSSQFYIDCKTSTMRREAARLIAAVFAPLIPPSAEAVGGLTAGADPIAYALRDLCQQPLHAFMVRKARKEHGLEKLIEGPIREGMSVVVVDDVVTTGSSTIAALEACKAEGLKVAAVLVLVDRQEDGGLERVRKSAGPSVPVRAVFTKSDLHQRWLEVKRSGNPNSERPRAAAG